jgi:hypothetical protein
VKKEVESDNRTIFFCPYCNSEHDDEFWAEECRDKCYELEQRTEVRNIDPEGGKTSKDLQLERVIKDTIRGELDKFIGQPNNEETRDKMVSHMTPANNFPVQSQNSGLFKPYDREELHGLKGTMYIGVDSAYGDDKTTVAMFKDDETGKCYVIDIDHARVEQ